VRTASIAGRIASPALALVVLLSLYAQYTAGFAMPRALGFVPLPAAYDLAPAMRGDSGILTAIERAPDGPLLELPATRGPDSFPHPALNARAMQRAIYHRRPLLNGFTGFWPPGFRERMAQAARLPASDALESLRNETGLALVLVDLRELGRDAQIVCAVRHATQAERSACRASYAAEQRQAWLDAASPGARHDIKLLWRDGDDLLFGLVEHSPESSHR
jgi:hypothetical protein